MAHRVWSSPRTCAQDHPWTRQSAKLCDDAVRDITNRANLELRLRVLLPSARNLVPLPPSWGTPRLPFYIDWGGPTASLDGAVRFKTRV
eukprot:9122036-Pyramimonas_sp.AAC.1